MASDETQITCPEEDSRVIQIVEKFCEIELHALEKHEAVSIYRVPRSLSSAKPEAFVPQFVGLGPYHHFRRELHEHDAAEELKLHDPTEELKLTTAKWVLKEHLPDKETLCQLVEEFNAGGPFKIEDYYHKPIPFEGDILKYIMAIDGLVLLDLLHSCVQKGPSLYILTGERQLGLVNSAGLELTRDAILRDAVKLENQIPLWILRKILENKRGNPDKELLDFLEAISPLKGRNLDALKFDNCHHLLHLIYDYSVDLPPEKNSPESPSTVQGDIRTRQSLPGNVASPSRDRLAKSKKLLGTFFHEGRDTYEKLKQAKPNLPNFLKIPSSITPLFEQFKSTFSPEKNVHEPVTIPSVTELYDAGIKFQPVKGGIDHIKFDKWNGIFSLPVIAVDVNTEVILRNLVAYETLNKPKLLFTRYVELMRAIIDTAEDVKLLVEAKIIVSSLKFGEVEKLFNGMSKSIRPTETPDLEENIKKLNEYYDGSHYRRLTKYVYSFWRSFTLFATLLLLAQTAVQTVCSVYDCPRKFDIDNHVVKLPLKTRMQGWFPN